MEKRDLLEGQIEQLSTFLKKLLANFLKLKSTNSDLESVNFTTDEFKKEFNFDLNQFLNFSKEDLNSFILNRKLTESHLESLSNLLYELSLIEFNNNTLSQQYLTKAIDLLDAADTISNAFSLNRANKKSQLNTLINQL